MDLAYSIAGNVLQKLVAIACNEISLARAMKDDLSKLERTMSTIKAVLLDAEKKQEQDEQLRNWLMKLRDVFLEVEDVLDELECEDLRSQVVQKYGSIGRKVSRFFSRSNPLVFQFSIAHRIKEIRQNLDEIAKDRSNFQLINTNQYREERHFMHILRETHSFVKDSDVIGRDSDRTKIMDTLMYEEDNIDGRDIDKAKITDMLMHENNKNVSVIPILGFGGLGKTTLAKSIYNNKELDKRFDLKLWVCVSLDFDVAKLTREILISANNVTNTKVQYISYLSMDQLQTSLQQILKDKRLLLVLDDVWNEDTDKWLELRNLLTEGPKECKIIVTTRSKSVASIMGTTPPHHLECLSYKDSLSLFLKCAFGDEEKAKEYPNLRKIGKKIVKKCKGVPLSLKTRKYTLLQD